MIELDSRIDKVLREQFPDTPKAQREYARLALISALAFFAQCDKQGTA